MVLRLIGKVFVSAGIAILLFLLYQLFGTNLQEKQEQQQLAAAFAAAPALPEAVEPDLGSGIAIIKIPKIGVNKIVLEGVGKEDLKRGPGHYPGTAMPGEKGNVVISGHRTTFGAPFYDLDQLTVGDVVILQTKTAEYTYRITERKIVLPTDRTIVTEATDSRLTLTTCEPRFSAAKRLIVVGQLENDEEPA